MTVNLKSNSCHIHISSHLTTTSFTIKSGTGSSFILQPTWGKLRQRAKPPAASRGSPWNHSQEADSLRDASFRHTLASTADRHTRIKTRLWWVFFLANWFKMIKPQREPPREQRTRPRFLACFDKLAQKETPMKRYLVFTEWSAVQNFTDSSKLREKSMRIEKETILQWQEDTFQLRELSLEWLQSFSKCRSVSSVAF